MKEFPKRTTGEHVSDGWPDQLQVLCHAPLPDMPASGYGCAPVNRSAGIARGSFDARLISK